MQPYTFTSREFDSETGLYHYRRRDLDAITGRFQQPDPISFAAGPNFYVYVQNNSPRWIDPLGLAPCDCPSGQWDMNIKYGGTIGLIFGVSRTFVDFSCVGGKQRCRGVVDCGSVGLQLLAALTVRNVEFESVGTGSRVSGFASSTNSKRVTDLPSLR